MIKFLTFKNWLDNQHLFQVLTILACNTALHFSVKFQDSQSASTTIFSWDESTKTSNDCWILPARDDTSSLSSTPQHTALHCPQGGSSSCHFWGRPFHCRAAHRGSLPEQFHSSSDQFVSVVFTVSPAKPMRSAHHSKSVSLAYTDERMSVKYFSHFAFAQV